MSPTPVSIGSRLELFVDDALLDELDGCSLFLHAPEDKGVVLVHDAPWEGNTCGYNTTFRDGGLFRTYYRGWHVEGPGRKEAHPATTCYAESRDGIVWTKPDLGLVEWNGSRANNIILVDRGTHNFAPFRDENPACAPEARYKGLGRGNGDHDKRALYPFHSADGIRWSLTQDTVLDLAGAFDSQNQAFWDPNIGQYRMYFRDFRQPERVRDIKTSVSDDFLNWTAGEWLDYPGAPSEHLYTNQIRPYHRAPHIYLGFPTRYLKERGQITEGLFMSSRDGHTFRRWGEAFLRPGLNRDKWGNRCNYIWLGLIETASDLPGAPPELSLFTDESYYEGGAVRTRRHTLRIDGFVSLRAPLSGGRALTRPLLFHGSELLVNVSTSAGGGLRVELQDEAGRTLPGFSFHDCPVLYGDDIERIISWESGSDVSSLAGRPLRIGFHLSDADLFSFRFR